MNLSVHPYFLEFIHPFELAHGTRTGTQLAYVKIEHNKQIAYGEASLPPYRKETVNSVKKWVEKQHENVLELLTKNPFENQEYIPFSRENPAASAALQTAILNWYVLSKDKKLTDFFETNLSKPSLTLTITKNDFPFISEKMKLAKHFTHFKLKLTGTSDDLDFTKAIRNKTETPFCIDINQGYKNKEDAIQLISILEKLHCVLIEQPLGNIDHDGHYWLKQRSQLPIIADESICLLEDLVKYHEAYSGVNIKMMKCGGLFQAQKMLQFNPNVGDDKFMKLIGCMSESSLGVSVAANLSPQADMVDLDSPYLNKNDPFQGFQILNGKIELKDKIRLRENTFFSD